MMKTRIISIILLLSCHFSHGNVRKQEVDTVRKMVPDSVAVIKKSTFLDGRQLTIKTNATLLAATVTNVGAELAIGRHYSLDISLLYSPYTIARAYKLQVFAFQPEFRYWPGERMKGHFLGLHLHAGVFNIAVDKLDRYQSPDGFFGVGASYGYALSLSPRWGAEFTAGVGYVHTSYDVYYNVPDGARYRKGVPYNYWGITRLGINLCYRIGIK